MSHSCWSPGWQMRTGLSVGSAPAQPSPERARTVTDTGSGRRSPGAVARLRERLAAAPAPREPSSESVHVRCAGRPAGECADAARRCRARARASTPGAAAATGRRRGTVKRRRDRAHRDDHRGLRRAVHAASTGDTFGGRYRVTECRHRRRRALRSRHHGDAPPGAPLVVLMNARSTAFSSHLDGLADSALSRRAVVVIFAVPPVYTPGSPLNALPVSLSPSSPPAITRLACLARRSRISAAGR